MAATYVTPTDLRAALGIGSLYDDETLEQVCQASENIISKYLWFNEYPIIGVTRNSNIATVIMSTPIAISTGQTVVIENSGAHYNGTHTVTGTYPWTTGSTAFNWWAFNPFVRTSFPNGFSAIQFTSNYDDDNYHLIVPYGKIKVTPGTYEDYADLPEIQLAALELAIDMWQARQQSNAGGVSPDGSFTPSPYRMGNSMIARIRGLLAPHLSPRGMVG